MASAALGLLLIALLWTATSWRATTRLLVAWDVASTLYLALAWAMMLRSSPERMKLRARLQDDGALAALVLSVLAATASLAAIAVELATVREVPESLRAWHVTLAGVTILTAWAFMHTTFAPYYANEFYLHHVRHGASALEFPGGGEPDYLDFLYFAFVIGTSGQTADVAMATRRMRRIGLPHCVLAFLFNATILAMTINIGASLF